MSSYSLLVKIRPAPGAETDSIKTLATSVSAQLFAARLAPWPEQKILALALFLKLLRTAFWTESDNLRVCITFARRTNQLRHGTPAKNQSDEEYKERENAEDTFAPGNEKHHIPEYQYQRDQNKPELEMPLPISGSRVCKSLAKIFALAIHHDRISRAEDIVT